MSSTVGIEQKFRVKGGGGDADGHDLEGTDGKVNVVPEAVYYVPQFISEEEERALLKRVNSAPRPKWTVLSNRRLQNWGGLPHPKGTVGEPLPAWLQEYAETISRMNIFEGKTANHVLVNEYTPGQGIMPHEDGPLFYPTISTITLGSHTVLNMYPKSRGNDDSPDLDGDRTGGRSAPAFSLLLEPRSLLVLKEEAYTSYLHGIEEVTCDTIDANIANLNLALGAPLGAELSRGTRISLTIRYVGNLLGGRFAWFGTKGKKRP